MKIINAPAQTFNFDLPYIGLQRSQDDKACYIFKLRFGRSPFQPSLNGGVQMSLVILSELVTKFRPVDRDVEHIVVDHMLAAGTNDGPVATGMEAVSINKALNKIAFDTKRAAGNHIVCHPADEATILGYFSTYRTLAQFHTVDHAPLQGKVICTYKGPGDTDSGPILVTTPGGLYAIAGATDTHMYVRILEIR